ncbi:class I SAM-dependent methyltransferase [Salinimicrobium tongyeongense]|uniref:Class I SAM-dependent methyltransferase n=1 Tax=Salinimicrobium tongyeongense TaxID=2809707 RepID=A0ABY6NSL2_9FLAO|nr:class I SAM-dependent methyltransferase [Salinimicrobium tongyeongense]UZH55646.1 class I SAM-dependent methyltransferase [Salinimicrobium tongyeongense]
MNKEDQNQKKNREHYERLYANYNIQNILSWINNLDAFLASATTTDTSWFAMYQRDFQNRIIGKRVLEMGCGDCVNAAVMAALGAEVYANDIAAASGEIVNKLNENYDFKYPIVFVEGDFLKNNLASASFDFVIGKAFLHHLTLPVEKLFLKETARLLKPGGEARFFEPAVNSLLLDELRWHIPVKGRPSKFERVAFKEWKENDPHPERSFSSKHFEKAGKEFFREVETVPVGSLERFSRLMPIGEERNRFRQWALRTEKYLPFNLGRWSSRSQLILYKSPIKSNDMKL